MARYEQEPVSTEHSIRTIFSNEELKKVLLEKFAEESFTKLRIAMSRSILQRHGFSNSQINTLINLELTSEVIRQTPGENLMTISGFTAREWNLLRQLNF